VRDVRPDRRNQNIVRFTEREEKGVEGHGEFVLQNNSPWNSKGFSSTSVFQML
jgi:hypothetical protein